MDTDPNPGVATDDDGRCVAAPTALAHGELVKWPGLGPQCSLAHAQKALGPSRGNENQGDLGVTSTPYRTYPATTAAPEGVIVWFREQHIVLVGVAHPTLAESFEASLGAPDGKERRCSRQAPRSGSTPPVAS